MQEMAKPQKVEFHFDERSLLPLSVLEAQGVQFTEVAIGNRILIVPLRQPNCPCPTVRSNGEGRGGVE